MIVKLVFGVLALGLLFAASSASPLQAQEETQRPNMILVLTDDMRQDDLKHMPRTQELLVREGTTFNNAFVPYAMCCPSRASILRGQYTRNHHVWDNGAPTGGFDRFIQEGHEESTVATWLKGAGYHTVLLGKYLNNYPGGMGQSYVPPGWDEWYGRLAPNEYRYYDYYLNENGLVVHYGNRASDYYTDVLSTKARSYLRRIAPGAQPFFMYLSVSAPHGPATPAERHRGMFSGMKAPRPPSFNEADVGDKPEWIREDPLLTERQISETDETYRKRLGTLQAVDDMIARLVGELEAQGELENTYIIFTSDNGWHQGEHRLTLKKRTPYEEAIRIPMVVRGPGVPAGQTRPEFALNIDLAPTFAELAGATIPTFVDGRSLRPLLASATPPTWRTAFLLENHPDVGSQGLPQYYGVRTARHKYVDMANGEKEFYDLLADPYELENSYNGTPPADLKRRLDALKVCAGDACRAAEDGP